MQVIHVGKNKSINSIQKAIELLNGDEATIYLDPGIYHEKIKINKSNLNIIGTNPNDTIIINNDFAKKIHDDGQEFNTFRTYTLMLLGSNINIKNIQVINSSGPGKIVGQAVALSVTGDNITISNSIFKAHQDTLFLGPLPKDLIIRYQNFLPKDELIYPENNRILLENCLIEGDVDFIFGGANAIFKNCQIVSLTTSGYVCAPCTDQSQEYGFTFFNCNFSSQATTPNTYLARPWRDYGKCVFINCTYGPHIYQEGFDKWNDSTRDKTCRFYEYNCKYRDGLTYERIYFSKTLTENERKQYEIENIFKQKG